MIQIGNDKIKDIYVGSDKIKEVYYGSEKVWTIQVGYWVHKNTGVKTYFDLEDPSIVDGIMSPPSWRRDCSEVKIPSGVTGLGINCFQYCSSLTSIILPEGITILGDNCFYNCTSLTSINIPEGVTSLGDSCFSGCSSLTSITLPESVTSLGVYCFGFCSALTSINIPEGVTSLVDLCFAGCASLTSITLPEGITSLERYCFNGCSSLTSITIPESVTSLGEYCFTWCTSLSLITVLPAIPPSLGSNAFNNVHTSFNIKVRFPYVDDYKAATNWINYETIISAIEDSYWVHKDTGDITELTLIWQDGFEEGGDPPIMRWNPNLAESWDSTDASEIKFPEGVEDFGYLTDLYVPNIVKLDLPSTTKLIINAALNGITTMESVTIRALVPPTLELGNPQSPNLRVYVPSESLALYKSTAPYSAFEDIIFTIP